MSEVAWKFTFDNGVVHTEYDESKACEIRRNLGHNEREEVQSGTVFETAAPEAQGEAVAWMWDDNDGIGGSPRPQYHVHHAPPGYANAIPLYAAPPAADARIAEIDAENRIPVVALAAKMQRIAELEGEAQRMREALTQYNRVRDSVGGCSDGACVVKRPTGMRTNGGCKCWKDNLTAQRMMRAGYQLAMAAEEALAEQEKKE